MVKKVQDARQFFFGSFWNRKRTGVVTDSKKSSMLYQIYVLASVALLRCHFGCGGNGENNIGGPCQKVFFFTSDNPSLGIFSRVGQKFGKKNNEGL